MDRLTRFWVIVSFLILPFCEQAFGDCKMDVAPDTIIIEWKSKGGLEKPTSAVADVSVFADGRVEVGPRFANGRATIQHLSEADLAALRRFVFEEQDIWSIDSDTLERDVQALANTNVGPTDTSVLALGTKAIADATTTVIRVRDGERQHEISHYNLFGAAQRYAQINELQRLRAIELRLLELAQQTAASAR